MTTVTAVYENGVLRPTRPLALAEGQTVEVTVAEPKPFEPPLTLAEWEQRIRAAKDIHEWVALANACPDPDPSYDVVERMNENRRASGERLLTRPDQLGGTS